MRTILYVAYLIGALITYVAADLLDPVQALPIIVLAPAVIFIVLELTGFLRFHTVSASEQKNFSPLINKALEEGLNDQQAASKYGWPIVVEMDNVISRLEGVLVDLIASIKNAKSRRELFADIVKGVTK